MQKFHSESRETVGLLLARQVHGLAEMLVEVGLCLDHFSGAAAPRWSRLRGFLSRATVFLSFLWSPWECWGEPLATKLCLLAFRPGIKPSPFSQEGFFPLNSPLKCPHPRPEEAEVIRGWEAAAPLGAVPTFGGRKFLGAVLFICRPPREPG